MKLNKVILGLSLIPVSVFAVQNNCKYEVDASTVKVAWTAYKTTEKTPVQGQVKELMVNVPSKATKSLSKLLEQVKASGSFDHEKKSDSGNPARDLTVFQKYFSLIASKAKFQGAISQVKGDDQVGELNLQLTFNDKSRGLPMKYTLSESGDFEAIGEFEMNDFNLSAALASIHQACEALHKGKDGISKTWPNVGLKISAKIIKDCAKK